MGLVAPSLPRPPPSHTPHEQPHTWIRLVRRGIRDAGGEACTGKKRRTEAHTHTHTRSRVHPARMARFTFRPTHQRAHAQNTRLAAGYRRSTQQHKSHFNQPAACLARAANTPARSPRTARRTWRPVPFLPGRTKSSHFPGRKKCLMLHHRVGSSSVGSSGSGPHKGMSLFSGSAHFTPLFMGVDHAAPPSSRAGRRDSALSAEEAAVGSGAAGAGVGAAAASDATDEGVVVVVNDCNINSVLENPRVRAALARTGFLRAGVAWACSAGWVACV